MERVFWWSVFFGLFTMFTVNTLFTVFTVFSGVLAVFSGCTNIGITAKRQKKTPKVDSFRGR
jgi:hypothetical protein